MDKQRGFTLIELMVVISSKLLLLSLPSLNATMCCKHKKERTAVSLVGSDRILSNTSTYKACGNKI
ncbi:prepilin-type N-terminal cleavage/methylation domain-containing protein [Citrobacter youngae]|uniref:prepilin-type N-terminal cleavage/methylation domain-containing protein n=1 Tax=Citrobacter TaxID=544 RepID=UPI002FCD86E8